jgi:hypothetical protein
MESANGEPRPIPRDVLEITQGLNTLLNITSPHYHQDGIDPWGMRRTSIDIAEKPILKKGLPPVLGVRLEAGTEYGPDGSTIRDCFARLVDDDAGFTIGLPLDHKGRIDPQEAARWDTMTKQKVHVILDRLVVVSSANED